MGTDPSIQAPFKPAQIDALLKWVDNNDRIYSSTHEDVPHRRANSRDGRPLTATQL